MRPFEWTDTFIADMIDGVVYDARTNLGDVQIAVVGSGGENLWLREVVLFESSGNSGISETFHADETYGCAMRYATK